MVRFVDSGGESDVENDDGLAPVTSLFGERGGQAYPKTAAEVRRTLEDRVPETRGSSDSSTGSPAPGPTSSASEWRTDWDDHSGAGDPPTRDVRPIDFTTERADRARTKGAGSGRWDRGSRSGERVDSDSVVDATDAAERGLLKKLRARQLSVSEAKAYLAQHDLDAESVDALLDAFIERGYLDDARLAEQVVHSGVDRKNQGRQVISQSLAKRGVPRDVADAALAELPDDDAERALEFARSKAGSMRALERDVALRRLAGQLARRGYGGSVALNAARSALDELTRPMGRVRFEER